MVGTSVSVGLLGPLSLSIDGRTLGPRDFGGRKPKQVLEILLLNQGQVVPKDRLIDLLWGDTTPRDPARTLEAYVSGVRSRLHTDADRSRDLLRTEPGAYRFCLDDATVDLWQFDSLVMQAAQAAAVERFTLRQRALDLVDGELLEDEPYAEWVLSMRDLYAERHSQLLLDVADDSLATGRADLALKYAEGVLAAQPARERAYRILMAARYAMGEQDLALRVYDRCRIVLRDELGVDPLAETEQLYLDVLNQEPLNFLRPGTADDGPAPAAATAVVLTQPRHPTQFAFLDRAAIAYQVVGDGPIDVVFAQAGSPTSKPGGRSPATPDSSNGSPMAGVSFCSTPGAWACPIPPRRG